MTVLADMADGPYVTLIFLLFYWYQQIFTIDENNNHLSSKLSIKFLFLDLLNKVFLEIGEKIILFHL